MVRGRLSQLWFAIWLDLTRTQLLKYAIKTRPTVLNLGQLAYMAPNSRVLF